MGKDTCSYISRMLYLFYSYIFSRKLSQVMFSVVESYMFIMNL